jgi:hypothetical protein
MQHAIDILVLLLMDIARIVMEVIGLIDGFLAAIMTTLGIGASAQGVILLLLALCMIIFAVRVLGGLIGALLVVLIVLLILHQYMPNLGMPPLHVIPPVPSTGT